MRKAGSCCEEWVCTEDSQLPKHHTVPKKFRRRTNGNQRRRHHHQRSAARLHHKQQQQHKQCDLEETQWSQCTKTCGWGTSTKLAFVKGGDCKLEKLERFCQIRPCDMDLKPKAKVRNRFEK